MRRREVPHALSKGLRQEGGGAADLPTGATVMPPPGERELAGADHAHGGPQVRDPDGSF